MCDTIVTCSCFLIISLDFLFILHFEIVKRTFKIKSNVVSFVWFHVISGVFSFSYRIQITAAPSIWSARIKDKSSSVTSATIQLSGLSVPHTAVIRPVKTQQATLRALVTVSLSPMQEQFVFMTDWLWISVRLCACSAVAACPTYKRRAARPAASALAPEVHLANKEIGSTKTLQLQETPRYIIKDTKCIMK